jgi:hypothetical protein
MKKYPAPVSPSTPATPTASAETRQRPLEEDIARRAKELWERYNRPSGRDEQIWLEAERQLLGTDAHIAATENKSMSALALQKTSVSISPPDGGDAPQKPLTFPSQGTTRPSRRRASC